jgi:hypothetical protein
MTDPDTIGRLLDRLPFDLTHATEPPMRAALVEAEDRGFRLIALILSPGATRSEAEMLIDGALEKLAPAHEAGHA